MKKIEKVKEARDFAQLVPHPLVLVPTMGALHEGHVALIRQARHEAGSCATVAVSIFVNPLQFGPSEDFSSYPRTLEADLALCEREGVNLLFCPNREEIYASDASVTVEESELSSSLCGASRPGHFRGVATVVTKLFNILTPDSAIFGEKDWQQLAVIRRMVRDLHFPIQIVSHPTIREKDGLAISSRNNYLSSEERAVAPKIYEALQATALLVQAGKTTVSELLVQTRTALALIPKATIDYVEIVDEKTLQPLSTIFPPISARLMVAVKLGKTRLIDNITLQTESPHPL